MISSDDLYERCGFHLLLDRRSLFDRVVIEQGDCEADRREVLFRLAEMLPAPRIFLDIGSYYGHYSLHAQRSGLFAKVYAFESDPLNFSQLQANLFLNRMSDEVVARHVYVTDRPSTASTTKASFIPENRGGAGMYYTDDPQHLIPGDSIDNMLPLKDQSVVMKIDAENGEIRIIHGLERTFAANRVVAQIEHCGPAGALSEWVADQKIPLRHVLRMGQEYYFTNCDAVQY
jgi:FkbM family methyltransferase